MFRNRLLYGLITIEIPKNIEGNIRLSPIVTNYRAKDGTDEKVFDALEWLAAMCSHIPDRGEQMVRYYGYYSNVCRGKRKETEGDGVPCILEADKSSKEYRKNWARLIQKIYEVDPLTCPKCRGVMRIISLCEAIDYVK